MASKVEALIRNFLKTDGEALYLVPGEKIFIVKGTNRLVVGRENLGEESFRAVAAELVPGAPVESLAAMKHRVPVRVDESTDPVEIQFGKSGNSFAIMICRQRAAEPPPEPEAAPEPAPPRVEPRPAPPARAAGGTTAYTVPASPPLTRAAAQVVALDVPETLSSRDLGATFLKERAARGGQPLEDALRRLVSSGASDLHLAPEAPPAYRIAGELSVAEELPAFAPEDLEKAVATLLTERARRELEASGTTVFALDHPVGGRLRVRVTRDRQGVAAEFRSVAQPPRVEEIGIPAAAVKLLRAESGLVVVGGPPGSGKTITRAALLARALGERPVAALLLEELSEIAVPRDRGILSVREWGGSADGLAGALRTALGEHADVLSSTEPHDPRALALLLEHAARRLVLVEVTAGSAPAALERLVDLAPEGRVERTRGLLAELLRAVLVQRLVPLVAGGRTAVFDLLLNTGVAANLIREGKGFPLASLLPAGRAQGMTTMNDGLADLVKRRVVSSVAALAASPDPAALRTLLSGTEAPAASEG